MDDRIHCVTLFEQLRTIFLMLTNCFLERQEDAIMLQKMYAKNKTLQLVDKQKLLGFIKHRERERTKQEGKIFQENQEIIVVDDRDIRFLNSQLEIVHLLQRRAITKKVELKIPINEKLECA